jgi:PAS domain S-box-containing protein
VITTLRAPLIVLLLALAAVTIVTAVVLLLARARSPLRAPLATALTFALTGIGGAAAMGAAAELAGSRALGASAGVALGVALLSVARIGLLRREHAALIGGNAAVEAARATSRATLRSFVALARLAERLPGCNTPAAIDGLLLDAARQALPDSVVALQAPGGVVAAGALLLRYRDEASLVVTLPRRDASDRNEAALTALEALVATAALGHVQLESRTGAEVAALRDRLRERTTATLAAASDAFGAGHACAMALAQSMPVAWVELVDGDVHTRFTIDEEVSDDHVESRAIGREGRTLVAAMPGRPDARQAATLDAVAAGLAVALDLIALREVGSRARARQAGVTAATAAAQGPAADSLTGVLLAARAALGADAAILYAVRSGAPIVLEAHGAEPAGCDGIAAQAIATARVVVDRDGRFLAAAPVAGMAAGMAAPLPGGAERGALAVLFTGTRALDDNDGADLGAFAQLAALALDRVTLGAELERRERLRVGFVDIAESLAGAREPNETFDVVATAARRVLRAAATVVVSGDDELRAVGASPTTPSLVDDAGLAGPLLALAARDRRIVLCADASGDRRMSARERARMLEAGHASALCIPIELEGGSARAVLGVVWNEPHPASDDDLELARHVAAAAAATIERARTLSSERRARARAQELQRIGGLMASNLDAPAVLREIVSQAALLLDADSCALRLVEGDQLVVRAVQGEAADILAGEQSALTGGLTGEVLARRTPVAVADMASDERFANDDPVLLARFCAYLGAPILSPDGDLRGVLALYDRRRRVWKEDEIEALEAFANSATVALQNALLYQRVAQEKEKSEAIIASIADGIVVVDPDGRVEMWNRAASAMTGVPSRSALRRTLRDVVRGELGDRDDLAYAALQAAATSEAAAEVHLSRGEREIWLSVRAAQLRDPLEVRVGTVYALRDVSADRQLDQLKSDFVATVSHELRTPLTSIYGFAETLLRSDVSFPDEDRRTFLGYIASESERLTRLVDGLLSVTRLEAGGVELDLADVDVSEVLREIVIRQSERARDTHQVDLNVPAEPLVAAADRDKLRQIVLNLVDNAIKYSPSGGTVTVTGRRQLDTVEIRVRDEGIGISAADQRNLFRKFFRADARMTRGIRGIGLGLYLTRGFVTAMGGRIRVESEAGTGSTFIVELPLRRGAGGGVKAA